MLRDVRVIGRGLDGDVHRQLHAVRLDPLAEVRERLEPAELRRHGVVAAVRGADGVRRPDVAGRRLERVVAALAVRVADGMDRQHVQHVESHLRDVRDAPLGLGERRGRRPLRIATLRAGEELVPGTEPGALAVDHERQLRGPRAGAAVGMASHAGQQVLADEGRRAGGLRACPAHRGERLPHEPGVVRRLRLLGPEQRALDQDPALLELVRHRDRCVELLAQPVAPRAERIPPRLDGVDVAAVAEQLHVARPAIVVDRAHRRIAPGGLVVGAEQQHRVEQVVPVGEDVGGHHQLIADDALDRVAPAVQLW